MDDKELLKKINLECALKGEPIKKLKDILKLYDKDYLSDFYYVITKKEIDESKENMINKIFIELTDEDNIDEILVYVNKIISDISMWGNKGWTNKEIILRKCYE